MITVNYNYGNGKLTLYPEKFFPATKGQIRKLYKLFFRIGDRGASAYVDECLQHLDERIPEEEQKAKELANEYVTLRTEQMELKQQIRDKKKTNGLPFRGDELKEYKKELKKLNEKVSSAKVEANRAVKIVPWLKENKELLKELDGR